LLLLLFSFSERLISSSSMVFCGSHVWIIIFAAVIVFPCCAHFQAATWKMVPWCRFMDGLVNGLVNGFISMIIWISPTPHLIP